MTVQPPVANQYFSRFGGLWTDRRDAADEIERRASADRLGGHPAELFDHFVQHGYAVIEHAVDPALCDRVRADIVREWQRHDTRLRITPPGSIASVPLGPSVPEASTRVVDAYVHLDSARAALFSPPIVSFLRALFDDDPLLFQSLSFPRGSEQGIHQDTAYVVTMEPLALAASWIALEDVQPGCGELMYYPGSHRIPDFLFSGEHKHFDALRDGYDQHDEWTFSIHAHAARLGLELERFRPVKGSVLIWAADLAHGGAPIEQPESTRHSLVGHYCPARVDPFYFHHTPTRATRLPVDEGWYSSYHHDLAATGATSDAPPDAPPDADARPQHDGPPRARRWSWPRRSSTK